MSEEEKNQAAAFLKLHEDVKKLILEAVLYEIRTMPHGEFTTELRHMIDRRLSETLNTQMSNYRIAYRGTATPY